MVRESIRYRPALVTMSGDKADDGQTEQFEMWAEVMAAYDRAGIPWFAGVGNHDRTAPPGTPGGLPENAPFFDTYKQFFADRPYPMGDEAGYGGGISPSTRPAGDPDGTSTHYFVDVGKGVRWIFIDNSCWSIIGCDPHQNPSAQNQGEAQFEFLERVAGEADEQGRLAFVVMHMPTRDPRDQSYADPIRRCTRWARAPWAPSTTPRSSRPRPRQGWTASSSATSRGSSSTKARARFPTSSTVAPAASCTRPARSGSTTATGTDSG